MGTVKKLVWLGTSLKDMMSFGTQSRKKLSLQLERIGDGLDPSDWRPFNEIGPGTREVRVRDTQGIYRIMYVAKFEEAVYVLHCFQKKTTSTTKQDKHIAIARYRELVSMRSSFP